MDLLRQSVETIEQTHIICMDQNGIISKTVFINEDIAEYILNEKCQTWQIVVPLSNGLPYTYF